MVKRFLLLVAVAIGVSGIFVPTAAQRKANPGSVCGDPQAACKSAVHFQPSDLPFDVGRNLVISESKWFYGIVLKSQRMVPEWGDCEHPTFSERERLEIQALFPRNKVFTFNCNEPGMNYYNGVSGKTAFIAVYAGRTLAEARAFLRKVQATKKFPGIRVRRMQAGINGT